jgi:hypothetical protein
LLAEEVEKLVGVGFGGLAVEDAIIQGLAGLHFLASRYWRVWEIGIRLTILIGRLLSPALFYRSSISGIN